MLMLINLLGLCLLLQMIVIFSMKSVWNKSKKYMFECGFNSFFLPRNPFSLQFFKILLIFLLFDMEIIVILPLCIFFMNSKFSILMFIILMLMLILGLIFEWKEGNLEWLD